MHPLLGRILTILMGLGFIAASAAVIMPSVKRGYFEGKHGKIFRRGEFGYTAHCGLMFLCMTVGGVFVGAGLVLSDEQLMRRNR